MMKRVLSFILPLLLSFMGFSQISGAYVSNIKLENSSEKWCWAIEQDNNNKMLLGVSKGIVVYDGVSQTLLEIPFTPLVMKYNKQSEILWLAGFEQIGFMQTNSFGQYVFNEIDVVEGEQFNFIQIFNDTVYIVSDISIVVIDAKSKQLVSKISIGDRLIDQAFVLNNKLVFLIDYFLFELNGEELSEITEIDFPVDDFSFAVKANESLILGTLHETYYNFKNNTFTANEFKSDSFFKSNLIQGGSMLSDNLIVLSSLTSGIALFDISTNKLVKEINYFTGLPDDEIRTLFVDKDRGIWVSHEFGISRIDVHTGTENYNLYPGLNGNPIAVQYYKNELYVATNDGLYTLELIQNYQNVTYEISIKESSPVIEQPNDGQDIKVPQEKQVVEKTRKERRRQSKKGNVETKDEIISKEIPKSDNKLNQTNRSKQQIRTRTLTKRKLQSQSQMYKMVDGLNDKCRQLTISNGYLLAAGNNGLYAVKNKTSKTIISDVYVHNIYADNKTGTVFCCTNNGLYQLFCNNDEWDYVHFYQTTNENVYSIAHETSDYWVIAMNSNVVKVKLIDNEIEELHEINLPEEPGKIFFVKNLESEIKVFTNDMIYKLSTSGDLVVDQIMNKNSYVIDNQFDYTFVNVNNSWRVLSKNNESPDANAIKAISLSAKVRYISVEKNGALWIVDERNSITKISNVLESINSELVLEFNGITLDEEWVELKKSIHLPAKMRNLSIQLSAPFYLMQNGIEFSYCIKGFDKDWSNWLISPNINIQYLPYGKYTLLAKAKDKLGNLSPEIELDITVARPFTQSIAFYFILIFVFVLVVVLYSKYRLRKLEKDKHQLEKKVMERTKTIEKQKNKIEDQHSEITQSIHYAKRIQTAMLPLNEIMDAMLPKHFVLFLPRDIVSGDFYFFKPIGKYIIFVVADCTGHGVPGGFMSMLGISYLSEITSQLSPTKSAAEIINQLREKIKFTLGQKDLNSTQKDGMDLAICLIDTEAKQLQFSGAFNPLFILRNNELLTIKADRQPVSVYYNETEFTNHVIDVQPGDKFYMFSDGYYDQIGGPQGRKFMSRNFKQLLIDINTYPMPEQKQILYDKIIEWQGDSMQVDDILVVGFEL